MSSIRPRAFPLSVFSDAIPRHWLGGSVIATALANGVNLLFPMGERFFVRSVRHFQKQIAADPALVEAVRGFAGQEGHHARAHEEVFQVLERQGFAIKPFLRVYEHIGYKVLEPLFSPSMRLAATAASEHFTAVLAENFLTQMDERMVHPAMRQLLAWHACEEIEHRAVAFDVFQKVDGRYSVRMGGLAVATLTLAGFWIAATLYLLSQEDEPFAAAKREYSAIKDHQPFGERVFGRGIREYIARDFHPSQRTDLDELARKSLRELEPIGLAPA